MVDVHQHRVAHCVPIVYIMRSELEIPLEFSGIRVESDQAASKEIVTGTHVAIHIRALDCRRPSR